MVRKAIIPAAGYGTRSTSDIMESILRGRSRFVMNTFSIEEFANKGKWQ